MIFLLKHDFTEQRGFPLKCVASSRCRAGSECGNIRDVLQDFAVFHHSFVHKKMTETERVLLLTLLICLVCHKVIKIILKISKSVQF